jgi:hypothetical protein
MRTAILVTAAVLAGLYASMAMADEVTDQIQEGLKAYEKGDLDTAAIALDTAGTLIRQMQANSLSNVLPDPLSGWSADDAETSSAGAAMLGGGLQAERTYRKEDEQVTISIVGNSPMLQAMSMMFSNPAMMGGDTKLIIIDGRKVVQNKQDHSLQAMVANNFLVSVEGVDGTADESVKAYFQAVDFGALEKFNQ